MAVFTALAGYLSTALVGMGLSAAAAGVVANIAIGAVLIGASTLLSSGGARPTTSTPQAQATINQSAGARIRGYGKAKLGGTRAFWDSRNGALYQIVMAHHGEIDAFEQFYVGDLAVTRNEFGYVVSQPFAGPTGDSGWVLINEHRGTDDQAADGVMVADWPEVWTAAHRLRGIAYWMVRFGSPTAEQYQTVFPEGYNTPVRCVCRLSRVWDPRVAPANPAAKAWSDNAALCILDYLTHPDGYGRTLDDIDIDSFKAFANTCDELVPLAGGGTEKRYRIWGVYSLTDDPQDVLGKMRAACDAELYQTAAGKIAIRGGKWEAPTVTIRDSDVLGHSMEQGNNALSAFNELKIFYTSAAHDYQTMEAEAWVNEADQDERGVLSSELRLDMVPSASQARRLAKIHMAKSNPAWKGTVAANLSALNALGERTVRLVQPELGIDDAFFVAGFSIRPDLTGVELSLLSISEAAYLWTAAEEGVPPAIPEDTRPDLDFPVPVISSITAPGKVITATADDPGRTDVELQAEVRAGAGSSWYAMSSTGLTARYGPVAPASTTTYQVRARWRGPLGTAGQWSDLAEIEVS